MPTAHVRPRAAEITQEPMRPIEPQRTKIPAMAPRNAERARCIKEIFLSAHPGNGEKIRMSLFRDRDGAV